MNLHYCFEYQKHPYLNQATPKNACQNFSTKKHPEIKNFKHKKILWSSQSLEIRSTPLGIKWSVFSCWSPHCWTSQSCCLSSIWFSKCEHLFIDKPMVITESALLLNMGLKLQSSNKQHATCNMLNKDLTFQNWASGRKALLAARVDIILPFWQ